MGVDVYLEWEGMTEEDKEKQYTGFDIGAGKYGYLRAAYWDSRWVAVYRALFEEAWNSDDKVEYNFTDENYWKKMYVVVAWALEDAMKEVAAGNMDVEDFYWEIVHAKSVYDFFKLAKKKQEEGRKVWVIVSW